MKAIENYSITQVGSYHAAFWDAARLRNMNHELIQNGRVQGNSTYFMPEKESKKIREKILEHSAIRPLATQITHYQGNLDIMTASSEDAAEFLAEGSTIPGFDADDDFNKLRVERHKAAALVKISEELVYDDSFDIQNYIIDRMARSFARAEEKAFIGGTGINEPTGLLHASEGAETASNVDSISYDNLVDLFFSVKLEYRKNAVWMMNDATALSLRKLKDADGNYLWNQTSDTILGKTVVICNDMPDAESGKRPILFGDLSYYGIIDRSPVSMKVLSELYAANNQIGYVGNEFLDAKLIRKDAMKVIAIK